MCVKNHKNNTLSQTFCMLRNEAIISKSQNIIIYKGNRFGKFQNSRSLDYTKISKT